MTVAPLLTSSFIPLPFVFLEATVLCVYKCLDIQHTHHHHINKQHIVEKREGGSVDDGPSYGPIQDPFFGMNEFFLKVCQH